MEAPLEMFITLLWLEITAVFIFCPMVCCVYSCMGWVELRDLGDTKEKFQNLMVVLLFALLPRLELESNY